MRSSSLAGKKDLDQADGERGGEERNAEDKPSVVVYSALAANIGIAIAKFLAAAVTGSSAMLAEAIHSVSDTGNEILLLVGRWRARRGRTAGHPFGYGKELYFWGLMVAVLVFAVGGTVSVLEGVSRLHAKRPPEHVAWSYAVLGVSFVLELGSFVVGIRKLLASRRGRSLVTTWRESKDPTVFTVVAEDGAALVGVLIAAVGIFLSRATGDAIFDALASLLIAALLIAVSLALVWENRGLLIGESAPAPLVAGMRKIIEGDPAVHSVGPLLTMHMGPDQVLLDMDLEFEASLSIDELRGAVRRIERRIQETYPIVKAIYIGAASLGGPTPNAAR